MNESSNDSDQSPKLDLIKPEVSFDDFIKMDLRVAMILGAQRVPKSDKLVQLTIDLGIEKRIIVAGIGKAYEPEFLINKKIVVIANLAPRSLMGIESRGMVMAASGEGTLPFLLEAPSDSIPGHIVR